MTSDKTVWIRDTNGAIEVQAAPDGAELEVHATRYGSDVRVVVVPSERGVTFCAMFHEDDVCGADGQYGVNGRLGSWQTHQVHFVVRLPKGVAVDASSVNGSVDVAGASASVTARTTNGSVDAATDRGTLHASTTNGGVHVVSGAGPVEAQTVNGGIEARIESVNEPGAIELSSVNGSIALTLPAAVDADVTANTVSGSTQTARALNVTSGPAHHELRGTLGAGGRRITLGTVNGSIRID
jgi:DUF4097 and DUF4098 domain-containing protein YvlB